MQIEYAGCLPTQTPFENAVAVYELVDTRDDSPFYVGISMHPEQRYRQHLNENSHTSHGIDLRIEEIRAAGSKVGMRVIGWYEPGVVDAMEGLEIARRVHAGFDLVNISGHPHHGIDYVALANERLALIEEIIGPDTD